MPRARNTLQKAMTYVLHYAPDNASLIIRLALEHAGVPYRTALVDRSKSEQRGTAYRALNPNGLIPAFETPQGTMFETGAILLWLTDMHPGLGPQARDPHRATYLKWLFFCANTVHPHLQLLFYPHKLAGDGPGRQKTVTDGAKSALQTHLSTLDGADIQSLGLTALDLYIAPMLRWCAIYGPEDRSWFNLADYPRLAHICAQVEGLPATAAAQTAEGLGPTPFTAPRRPNPPEGFAL